MTNKRRTTIAPDNTAVKTLSAVTQLLPAKIRFRAETCLVRNQLNAQR